MKAQSPNAADLVKCLQCSARVPPAKLRKHLAKHETRSVFCPKCAVRLKRSIRAIQNHFRVSHRGTALSEGDIRKIATSGTLAKRTPEGPSRSVFALSGGAFELGRRGRR